MAKVSMCTVFDSAAQAYNRPIFVGHANLARRSFQVEVNRRDKDNQMFSHPDDFELYELGFFDDSDASFHLHPSPVLVCRAKDMIDDSPSK